MDINNSQAASETSTEPESATNAEEPREQSFFDGNLEQFRDFFVEIVDQHNFVLQHKDKPEVRIECSVQ